MEKGIVKFIVLCLCYFCAAVSFADFDYVITDVYYDDTLTLTNESVQVTGAGVYKIIGNEASYVNIVNTTPHQSHVGGITRVELHGTSIGDIDGGDIDSVGTYDSSTLNISGGNAGVDTIAYGNATINISGGDVGSIFLEENSILNLSNGQLNWMAAIGNSTAVLTGGDIGTISNHLSTSNKSITIKCQPGWSWLTDGDEKVGIHGYWANSSEFSIDFYNNPNYDPVWTNINIIEIPEPATLVLFGLGGLLLRRKENKA